MADARASPAYFAITGYGIVRDLESCLAVMRDPHNAARRFKKCATFEEALRFVYAAEAESPNAPAGADTRNIFSDQYIE